MSETTPFQEIQTAMAKAFFCCAYADMADESDNAPNMCGRDWMDVLPDTIDPAALRAAKTLIIDMFRMNTNGNSSFMYIYWHAEVLHERDPRKGDRDFTPENFGHYCAMQAMGQGVGLRDAFGKAVYDGIIVPYVEFGSHSLQLDYDFTGL